MAFPLLAFVSRQLPRGRRNGARWRRTSVARAASGPRVAVIGAGPAGLATALALRKEAGLENVTVYERAAEIRPGIGGGVQLHSGAALLQNVLGVELKSWSRPLRRIRSRGVDGSELLQLDLSELCRTFEPFSDSLKLQGGDLASCTVMRDALLQEMAKALPDGSIRCGAALEDVRLSWDSRTVECCFKGVGTKEFELVIAADGIGSLSRPLVTGETGEDLPRYTGLRIQYGVREAGGRPAGSEEEAHQWFGEGVYALTASYGGLDGKMFEMVAVVFRDDKPAVENTNWDPVEVQRDCLQRLKDAGHVREVLDVVEGCDRFFELGVCERPVGIDRWHRGRLVLAGDSAHAMPPFLGQGANQAIQDAVCLARCLRKANFSSMDSSSPLVGAALEAALLGYTAQRLPPCALLGFESGFLGQVETLPGSLGSLVRDNFFRLTNQTGVAGLVFLNGAIARV